MSETYQMKKVSTSGNYTVYDSTKVAGSPPVKGFALISSVAEKVGDFLELSLSEEGATELGLEKVTSRTGRYSTEGGAVRHIYFAHDVLDSFGGSMPDGEDAVYEAPEAIGISLSASTEDAFEEAQESTDNAAEDEAAALLGDSAASEEESESEEESDLDDEVDALLTD